MVQSPSSPQFPQNVAVVIEINAGSFVEGFSLSLQIFEDGRIIQEHNNLPPIPAAPQMPQLYGEWQKISGDRSRALQAVSGQETNVSDADWRKRTTDLSDCCRRWFRDNAFGSLRDRIRANARVRTDQSVPIIIRCSTAFQTENDILRRLPWHLWDLFSQSQLPNAEFALFTQFHRPVAILQAPIRVLAIFGSHDGGLQLEKDEEALQTLKQGGAEITRIPEPSPEILSHLLFDGNWDILFFAGHSSSQGNSGTIQISQGNDLPLDALRQSLTTAVTRGLKLAIFNSCDGLGIADFLIELNVPVVIVMREPVPDRIAGQFLLNLLRKFSEGTPLFLAVRKAREYLEAIEFKDFPAASWLPVICVNPNQPELVWPAPISEPPPPPQPPRPSLLRRLLSNLRHFITRFLVSPALSLLSRSRSNRGYYFIIIRFAAFALAVLFAVISPILHKADNQQPYIEAISVSKGNQAITGSIVQQRGLSEEYRLLKEKGIEAFHSGNYPEAVNKFDELRNLAQTNKKNNETKQAALVALQDPEVLIYRNNAYVNDPATKNPNSPIYTIAVAAPLNLDAGLHILFGVAQAQNVAVNQKKINLQVVIANDNNNPDQARQIAEKLYNNDEILAVVGHYTSENTCRALNVYSQDKNSLVIISPTSSVFGLQILDECGGRLNRKNQVFFRTASSTKVEAENLLKYFYESYRKNPNLVIFYNRKEFFSKNLAEQFEELIKDPPYQGRLIDKFDLSDETLDPKKLPQDVENAVKKANVLAVLPDGKTSSNKVFNKTIDIINWNDGKKPILGANTLYLGSVLNQIKNINNLYLAVEWHPDQHGAEDFADQIRKDWGGNSNRRTALAYEAVQALLQPMKQLQPMSRRDFKNKFSDPNQVAALSDTIKSIQKKPILPISFHTNSDHKKYTTGDRRENATLTIVKPNKKENDNQNLNEKFELYLIKNVDYPK
ncbi:MAG: ABC transporter substrate-binding protein [Nostoc sp.]|uniref:ABC transporter substrate-binding protein n=1 Tax=Nostoc sp. TaxID=1180 RepID=UPI002FF707A1